MSFKIKDTALLALVISISIKPDAAGNPGIIAGPLTYTSDDNGTLVKLVPSEDTLSVAISKVGPLGTANITVTDGVTTQTFPVEIDATETTGFIFTEVVQDVAAAAGETQPVAALETTQVASSSTADVSALSTEQVAALATTDVAALATTDVAALSTAQV